MYFESLFVNPGGRTPRGHFIAALVTLLAAVAFYVLLVNSRTGQFCLLMLLYPGFVLHARRLHDMGHTAWLLLVPTALLLAAFGIWLGYIGLGSGIDVALPRIALTLAAAFALWGCIGKDQGEANRYGAPVSS